MSSPVVSPSPAAVRGLGEQLVFTVSNAAAGGINWTTSSGSISAGGVYTPPNRTGNYTVTATRNRTDVFGTTGEATVVAVTVTGVLPFDPSDGSDGAVEKKVFASQAVSRARQLRAKSHARRRYNLVFRNRADAELDEAEAFFAHHQPTALGFLWTNKTLQQERTFVFSADELLWVPDSFDNFEYRFPVREKTSSPAPATTAAIQTLALEPDYSFDAATIEPALFAEPLGGKRVSRAAGGYGRERSFVLKWNDREPAEFLALEEAWIRHYPGRVFAWTDPVRGTTGNWRFDSDITFRDLLGTGMDFTVTIRRAVGPSLKGATPA